MYHMSRRLVLSLIVISTIALSLGSMPAVTHADAVIGCYVDGPLAVNEQGSIEVTINCNGIVTTNDVFGFQFSTSRTGDFDAAVAPSAYLPGTFADLATGVVTEVIATNNTLPGLYVATRKNNEVVTAENFTLATFTLTAEDNLTADGLVVITMSDPDFILSDDQGVALAEMLRDVNDLTVTINDIDLAWLSGDMEVRSDVTAIANMDAVELIIGDETYSAANVATYTNTFAMNVAHQYGEVDSPASDGTLAVIVSADIWGHLACYDAAVNLGDTGGSTDVDSLLGTLGTITLLSGDADNDDLIDNDDATMIGANLGTSGALEDDVNGDGTINVLDLVHVGRNFTSTMGSCVGS